MTVRREGYAKLEQAHAEDEQHASNLDEAVMKNSTALILAFLLVTFTVQAQHPIVVGLQSPVLANSIGVYGNREQSEHSELARNITTGVGLYAMFNTSNKVRLGIGVQREVRGFRMASTSTDDHTDLQVTYVDVPVTLHYYFSGTATQTTVQPYASLGVIPGFYVSGETSTYYVKQDKTTSTSTDDESMAAFHLGLRLQFGLDFMLSDLVYLGVATDLSHSVTQFMSEDQQQSDRSVYFNSIGFRGMIGFRL